MLSGIEWTVFSGILPLPHLTPLAGMASGGIFINQDKLSPGPGGLPLIVVDCIMRELSYWSGCDIQSKTHYACGLGLIVLPLNSVIVRSSHTGTTVIKPMVVACIQQWKNLGHCLHKYSFLFTVKSLAYALTAASQPVALNVQIWFTSDNT